MDVVLRPANEADIPDLAHLFIMASDGIVDAMYHDLVPGVPTEKLFEWRFSQAGSVKSYEFCWIAQQGQRAIGMVRAFPIEGLAEAPSDPRLTADRLAVLAPDYVPFSISATLEAEVGRDPEAVKQEVKAVLDSRLVLVDMGDGKLPRQPGIPVTIRDVTAWIRLVDGVARVTRIRLMNGAGKTVKVVEVSASGLPRYDSRGSTISVSRAGQGGAA